MDGIRSASNAPAIGATAPFAALWRAFAILLVVLLAGLAAFGVTLLMPRHYRAETRLVVVDTAGGPAPVAAIRSPALVRQVAEKLHVAARAEDRATRGSTFVVDRLVARFYPRESDKAPPSPQATVDGIEARLGVHREPGSDLIVVDFSSRDPQLAADLPNELAKAYLRQGARERPKTVPDPQAAEIDRLRGQLAGAERKLAAYQGSSAAKDRQNAAAPDAGKRDRLAGELSKARSDLAGIEARTAALHAALDGGDTEAPAGASGSPALDALYREREAAGARLAELSKTLGYKHPRIRAAKAQIVDLNDRIKAESRRLLARLEDEAGKAQDRERQIAQRLKELKKDSAKADTEQPALKALRDIVAADRASLDAALKRQAAERKSADAKPQVTGRIVALARVPTQPYAPQTLPIVVAAMLAAFVLASLFAMISALRHRDSGRPISPAPPAEVDGSTSDADSHLPLLSPPVAAASARQTEASDPGDAAPIGGGSDAPEKAPATSAAVAMDPDRLDGAHGRGCEMLAEAALMGDFMAEAGSGHDDNAAAGEGHPETPTQDDEEKDLDFSIAAAAARLFDKRRGLAVCVSPEGDEGAAATVILARLLAEEGMRIVLLDMTATGSPTRLMANERGLPGIADVLAGGLPLADAIHGDRLSPAHLVPRGTAGFDPAARSMGRLASILEGLRDAYQIVLVECGACDAEDVVDLVRHAAGCELLLNVVQPEEERFVESLSAFYRSGFQDPIVVMPDLPQPHAASGHHAA